MSELNLTDYQKDIFREIGNVGIGHGANALSTMISRDVVISIPDIQVVNIDEIFSKEGEYMISNCGLEGDLEGSILGIFDKTNALGLVDLMMFQPKGTTSAINEDVKSAFNEMVNVVGGCYLNALADMLQLKLMPKPPVFQFGNLVAVKDTFVAQFDSVKNSFFVKTRFTIGGEEIVGAIYLIFSDSANQKILELINNMQ